MHNVMISNLFSLLFDMLFLVLLIFFFFTLFRQLEVCQFAGLSKRPNPPNKK